MPVKLVDNTRLRAERTAVAKAVTVATSQRGFAAAALAAADCGPFNENQRRRTLAEAEATLRALTDELAGIDARLAPFEAPARVEAAAAQRILWAEKRALLLAAVDEAEAIAGALAAKLVEIFELDLVVLRAIDPEAGGGVNKDWLRRRLAQALAPTLAAPAPGLISMQEFERVWFGSEAGITGTWSAAFAGMYDTAAAAVLE